MNQLEQWCDSFRGFRVRRSASWRFNLRKTAIRNRDTSDLSSAKPYFSLKTLVAESQPTDQNLINLINSIFPDST